MYGLVVCEIKLIICEIHAQIIYWKFEFIYHYHYLSKEEKKEFFLNFQNAEGVNK